MTLILSLAIPMRLGYTFLGWSTSSIVTNVTYSASGRYNANELAILYVV